MFQRSDKLYPANIVHLTPLRFGAAFVVVIYHYLKRLTESGFPAIESYPILSYGYLGVDFFFILSGFILSHVYKNKIMNKSRSAREFYLLRLARLYPVHVTIVLLEVIYITCFIYVGTIDSYFNHTLPSLINTLLLTHAWGVGPLLCYNCPSWSLSAEWFAYLLFPFIILPFFRLKLCTAFILTAIIAVLSFSMVPIILGSNLTDLSIDFGILRIIPEFIFGMFLYAFGSKYRFKFYKKKHFYIIIALMIITSILKLPTYVMVILFGGLIIQCAEQARQGVIWSLCSDRSVYLGDISYSIYMLHVPLIQFVILLATALSFSPLYVLSAWGSCFGLLIILSMGMYKYVEVPCRKYIREKATLKKKDEFI